MSLVELYDLHGLGAVVASVVQEALTSEAKDRIEAHRVLDQVIGSEAAKRSCRWYD